MVNIHRAYSHKFDLELSLFLYILAHTKLLIASKKSLIAIGLNSLYKKTCICTTIYLWVDLGGEEGLGT